MRAAVLGGKLQGIAAAYLAHQENWGVVLVDRHADAPARELADIFYCFDIFEPGRLCQVLQEVDFVIPAIEQAPALEFIARTAGEMGKKILFDREAYAVSSSKLRSDEFFAELGIPAPRKWPGCSYPLLVKPSGQSGSHGVRKVHDEAELKAFTLGHADVKHWVIQEFLMGPSYSIEIVAHHGRCCTFQVTELEMDEIYDCKRVLAPCNLSTELMQRFSACAVRLAEGLHLDGIMDVEVILHEGELKVLEIDARLPSQTLTVVQQSSGINAVEVYQSDGLPGCPSDYTLLEPQRHVLYEHIEVTEQAVKVCGEHIMGGHGPLHYRKGFFGADEALTSYEKGKKQKKWVATLLFTADSREAVCRKEKAVVRRIMEACAVPDYIDEVPEV